MKTPQDEQSWMLGRRALVWSLVAAHLWGTVLIIAVLRGREGSVVGTMFDAVCFLIFSTLAVLVGGKAWKEFAPLKWGGRSMETQDVRNDQDGLSVAQGNYRRPSGFSRVARGGRVAEPYNREPNGEDGGAEGQYR